VKNTISPNRMRMYHQLTAVAPAPRFSLTQRKTAWIQAASDGIAVMISDGIRSTDVAKITGITPAVFTFKGM
jgi:hypothetical protein